MLQKEEKKYMVTDCAMCIHTAVYMLPFTVEFTENYMLWKKDPQIIEQCRRRRRWSLVSMGQHTKEYWQRMNVEKEHLPYHGHAKTMTNTMKRTPFIRLNTDFYKSLYILIEKITYEV